MSWDSLLEAAEAARVAAKPACLDETGALNVSLPVDLSKVRISGTISLAPAPGSAHPGASRGFGCSVKPLAAASAQAAPAPQPKARPCKECFKTEGHWDWCVGRGYSNRGAHPNAPKPEPQPQAAPAELELCCGGTCVRAVCEFHKGLPSKAKRWGLDFRLGSSSPWTALGLVREDCSIDRAHFVYASEAEARAYAAREPLGGRIECRAVELD